MKRAEVASWEVGDPSVETHRRIMIIAGEDSGESRAARLVEAVRERAPALEFFGIGGPKMRAAGVEILTDCRDMAVLGLFEVLRHFPFLYGTLRRMRRLLGTRRPDLLVLIDYSGFNLKLAKTARRLGIPVFYYISPQVWAWRQKRVFAIKERVDVMAVVFPFEVPFYERYGVAAEFVGHPLVDEVHSNLDKAGAARALGLDPAAPIVGLFPGSRRSELETLLPAQLGAAERLLARRPDVQFVLPRASGLSPESIDERLRAVPFPVRVVEERFYDVVRACDAVATASGTATLEVALMGVPMVVMYRVSPLSFRIMRRLIRLQHVALCNIVAGTEVARELLQDEVTPERIEDELARLLKADAHQRAVAHLEQVRRSLGEPGASGRAADLLLKTLAERTSRPAA